MSEAVIIRAARVADAPHLAAAEREVAATPGMLVSRPEELVDGDYVAKIRELGAGDRGCYMVAIMGDQIVGHAMLDPMSRAAVAHVVRLTIVVHPGWQGQGVGGQLLRALIDWAAQAPGVAKIELNVRAGNDRAIALYERCGFVEEGRNRGRVRLPDGRFIDDIAMGLWVGPPALTP